VVGICGRDANRGGLPQGRLWSADFSDYAAPRKSPPWGGGTGAPSAEYSLSLLRNVRIEMPKILAAWVRFPKQLLSVSRIKSRSTSATVRPTRARVTCSAAKAACATAPELRD